MNMVVERSTAGQVPHNAPVLGVHVSTSYFDVPALQPAITYSTAPLSCCVFPWPLQVRERLGALGQKHNQEDPDLTVADGAHRSFPGPVYPPVGSRLFQFVGWAETRGEICAASQ